MKKVNTKSLTQAAIIAALYCAINLSPLSALAFGPMQIRFAEALTVLPAVFPSAIPGLFIGCLITNIVGITMGLGGGLLDVIFGSLATLLAAWCSYKLRKYIYLVPLPPVIINAIVIGLILHFVINVPLLSTILFIGAGQLLACYVLGLPLLLWFKKTKNKNIKIL